MLAAIVLQQANRVVFSWPVGPPTKTAGIAPKHEPVIIMPEMANAQASLSNKQQELN
jgi:hypothetical protein